MFQINIEPYLFKFGFFELRYYGLVYMFGFLLVSYLLHKNREKLGFTREILDNFILVLMVGLLVGARFMHFLINQPSIFFTDPLELFKIWHGGMSFFGAFLGITLAGYYYLKKHNLKFFKTADIIVVPVALTLIFGRIANLINQELVGLVSNVPWCFNFAGYDGCRHPYQIYAAISHLILFLILIYVVKLKQEKSYKDGIVLLNFAFFYGLFRFIVDFYRVDPRYFGFTSWQYISIVVMIISLYYFKKVYLHRSQAEKLH
tara:strand:- start:818 stop:1597 length:780 start_codon:yes stop_codon:yes gene_type:complete